MRALFPDPLMQWGKGLSWRERLRRWRMTNKRRRQLRREERADD